jgi:hypothetical protein
VLGRILRLTFVSALVLPSTGLGTIVHFTLVRHALCPEHGSITHVDGRATGALLFQREGLTADEPLRPDHGHHHCLQANTSRHHAVVGPGAGSAACVRVFASPAAPETLAQSAVSLLTLAPKSSPPA